MTFSDGAAHLLGTELEVVADRDLQPLLDALQPSVALLRSSLDEGRYTLWLELAMPPTPTNVDASVTAWVALIEALPASARDLWNRSADRCLNTGFQAGFAPHASHVQLSSASMALAARLGLRFVVTVYAPDAQRLGERVS